MLNPKPCSLGPKLLTAQAERCAVRPQPLDASQKATPFGRRQRLLRGFGFQGFGFRVQLGSGLGDSRAYLGAACNSFLGSFVISGRGGDKRVLLRKELRRCFCNPKP